MQISESLYHWNPCTSDDCPKGDCTKVTSDMIAESVGVDPVIIRKTLSQLKKAGLIHVARGTGGVELAKAADRDQSAGYLSSGRMLRFDGPIIWFP